MRVEVDERSETIGYRIREAQVQQVPYMVVLGDKEAASGQVSVRHRRNGDLGLMTPEEFIHRVHTEIKFKQ